VLFIKVNYKSKCYLAEGERKEGSFSREVYKFVWSALVTASYLKSVVSSVFTGYLHVRLIY